LGIFVWALVAALSPSTRDEIDARLWRESVKDKRDA
jgi:hypothetical protein